MVESHRALVENMHHWINQDTSLLAMSNEVDYDQDAYAQQLGMQLFWLIITL